MKCIIVDDEPIARKGIKKLMDQISQLELLDTVFLEGVSKLK